MIKITEVHVIFGTGPLGIAVMKELMAKGKRIRMVNRSGNGNVPAEVEVVKGDATNSHSTREICKGATVVYNCAQPGYTEWPTKFPPLQAGIIAGAAAAEAKLVSAENTYMYGEVSGSQTEDLPDAAKTRKGRARAQMKPFIIDHNKYERAFGSDTTPHRQAVRQTLEWFRDNPKG